MECDFAHWGRSPLARCTKRPSDCGESAERSTTRRTLGERSGCTFVTANPVRGEQRRARPRDQIERGDGSVVGLSVADHWREHCDIDLRLRRQRPAGRQMLVVAGRACVVSGEEPWRAVAIKHLPKIGGASENVVVRIVSVGAEVVADPQSGICLWHDLHQPHCALWRNGARISSAFDALTAQIHFAGILNLCEASATKAVKGRAVRGLGVPAIAAGSARTEPSDGAPEHRKTHAAHITKRKDGERAGALASRVADSTTRRIGCRRDAMACRTAAQDSPDMMEWPPLLSPGVTAADPRDDATITLPLRFDGPRGGSRGQRSRRRAAGRNSVRRASRRTAGSSGRPRPLR